MDTCTARGISNLLLRNPRPHFAPNHVRTILQCRTRFPVFVKQTRFNYGLRYHATACLCSTSETTTHAAITTEETTAEATTTEETLSEATPPEESNTEATFSFKDEPEADNIPVEKKEECINQPNEVPLDSTLGDYPLRLLKILEDLNIKFNFEENYSYFALGGGGASVVLWIAVAVLGAIDSIPLFPKVLELIGLGYTLWFSTRYLIFKQNREELVAKVERFKQRVLGSEDD